MKSRLLISIGVLCLLSLSSCTEAILRTCEITIGMSKDGEDYQAEGIEIILKETSSSFEYHAATDASGQAVFHVMPGIYQAECAFEKDGGKFNASLSMIKVFEGKAGSFSLELNRIQTNPVIIKELYFSRCLDNAGKPYSSAAYMILYNNSAEDYTLHNFGIAQGCPSKADSTNPYEQRGIDKLPYIPALTSVWWFQQDVVLEAYSQIVISIYAAIDHTQEIPNSVDLSKADYVMYDPEVFNNSRYYFAPYSEIDKSHYMKTFSYAAMTDSWALSFKSPCLFIFQDESTSPEAFVKNMDNIEDPDGKGTQNCAKISKELVLDGVEIFDSKDLSVSHKRLASSVDAGRVVSIERNGYSVYRNVDKEATEALQENQGKIVYGYNLGTQDIESGSTDPSGIDAEKSLEAGAHIIYQDTNNSTKDFHLRRQASIKK